MQTKGIVLPYNEKVGQACKEGRYSEICMLFRRYAKSLHKSFENDCNYGLTERQQKREDRLIAEVTALAKSLDLFIYIQSDPRGGTIYLDTKEIPDNNYTRAQFIA